MNHVHLSSLVELLYPSKNHKSFPHTNGILSIHASYLITGSTKSITITSDKKGHLTDDEIEQMVAEAEQYAARDELEQKIVEAKNKLEGYLYSLKQSQSSLQNLSDNDKKSFDFLC